jgi:hypothetical protein
MSDRRVVKRVSAKEQTRREARIRAMLTELRLLNVQELLAEISASQTQEQGA